MEVFLKKFYTYLMDKYHWTPDTIDKLIVQQIFDLEFGDWKNKKYEPLDTIDNIPGF